MRPIVLPSNRPAARFYAGGAAITAFRGEPDPGPFTPEDWIASTTCVRDSDPVGLTSLPSGELLVEAVDTDPEGWLGRAHLEAFGRDPKLLVKLLDAGQRLPIHAHPDGAFARAHGLAQHGKAAAWYLLTGGEVHLGLRRPLPPAELARMVAEQAVDELLSLMHRVEVEPQDTVYVPPGLLHSIGAGAFLAEVQEPEDLSILLEWTGFAVDGAAHGHLGLGFDVALDAVESTARGVEEIQALVTRTQPKTDRLLPAAADPYFRLSRVDHPVAAEAFDAGFAVLICLDGDCRLAGDGWSIDLGRGATVVIPHAAGDYALQGSTTSVLLARPPEPGRANP